jgi:hypothetical protein
MPARYFLLEAISSGSHLASFSVQEAAGDLPMNPLAPLNRHLKNHCSSQRIDLDVVDRGPGQPVVTEDATRAGFKCTGRQEETSKSGYPICLRHEDSLRQFAGRKAGGSELRSLESPFLIRKLPDEMSPRPHLLAQMPLKVSWFPLISAAAAQCLPQSRWNFQFPTLSFLRPWPLTRRTSCPASLNSDLFVHASESRHFRSFKSLPLPTLFEHR